MKKCSKFLLIAMVINILMILSIPQSFAQSSQQNIKPNSRYQQEKIFANRQTVTLVSGGVSGTYIRFARDMANVLNHKQLRGLRVLPILGFSGSQNIRDILFLRGIDMGLAQSEHLAYLKANDPVLFNSIEDRVRYITKLYDSEFHVIAKKNIKKLEDLRGKTVNLWKPVSTTAIAGRAIFDKLNIKIKPIYIDFRLALEKVKSGAIGATILLAGAPVDRLSDMQTYENLHLVPVQYPELLDTFLPARLKHQDYPNLVPEGPGIPTVASSTVLAVYNWPTDSVRYRKLETFVQQFFSRIDKFRVKPYHPKWKNINLAASVPGWKRFKPAQQMLTRSLSKSRTVKNNSATFQNFQSFINQQSSNVDFSKLSEKEKNQFYKKFLQWVKQNQ